MLEKNRVHVTHQNIFLSLVLNCLNREDHTDGFAHLECRFSHPEVNVLQTLLAKAFEKRKRVLDTAFGDRNAVLEFTKRQIL